MSFPAPPWRRAVAGWIEDYVFPGDWPARLARGLGLQGAVRLRELRVALPGSALGRPLRIGFAADFHLGPMTDRAHLLAGCRLLTEARPDVLLLGGDYVDLSARRLDRIVPPLAAIPAPAGRFAVLGNHDWWTGPAAIQQALDEAGITVLSDRNARLAPPFEQVWICGLDDHLAGRHDSGTAFAGAEGIRVVLMHSPSSLLEIGTRRFELALTGHTHGGQIALPGGRPVVLPEGPLSRRYSRGRFELAGGSTLVVSTGLGFTTLPIRLFAAPEVLLCELVAADGEAT